MQRGVYLVAALQSQKFIAPGMKLIEELCKTLKLPAVGEMSKYAGMTEDLEMAEQKDVLDQLKIMIELNKAVTGKDGVLAGRLNESALGEDDPVRAFWTGAAVSPGQAACPHCRRQSMYGGVIPELQHVHKHGVPAWVRREAAPSALLLLCSIVPAAKSCHAAARGIARRFSSTQA
jgi:hypothetical protein